MFTEIFLVTKSLRGSFFDFDDFSIIVEQRAFESRSDAYRYFYYLKHSLFDDGYVFAASSKTSTFGVNSYSVICTKRNTHIKLSIKPISLMSKV